MGWKGDVFSMLAEGPGRKPRPGRWGSGLDVLASYLWVTSKELSVHRDGQFWSLVWLSAEDDGDDLYLIAHRGTVPAGEWSDTCWSGPSEYEAEMIGWPEVLDMSSSYSHGAAPAADWFLQNGAWIGDSVLVAIKVAHYTGYDGEGECDIEHRVLHVAKQDREPGALAAEIEAWYANRSKV